MTDVVRALLLANGIAFLFQLALPGLADIFVFVPPLVLFRPWSIVTYMFLHGGIMHLAFNMLSLFFFGPRVEDRMGSRRFAMLYFLSGIAGALFSFVFSFGSPIIGASAGVFGVMLAFAYFWPDVPIHIWGVIPVPARMLVIFTTLFALWSGFGGSRGGIAHFAHLGGYAGAYFYLKWLARGRGSFKKLATAAPTVAERRLTDWRSIDLARVHEANREEVERIVDKIGKTGLGSLTQQERVFLSHFVPAEDRVPPVQ